MSQQKLETSKRIVFPELLVQEVLRVCEQEGCSFSEWVRDAVEAALQDLQESGR